MANRTRIIEGTWACTSCGTKGILGRHKKCTTCNNPRELTGSESEFDFGEADAVSGKSLREGVTDEKALELAAAGEDWFCAFCGASNRGDNPRCKHCGAERGSDAGKLPEAPTMGPPVGASPSPANPRPTPASTGWGWRKGCMVAFGVLFGLFACCMALGYWAQRTHDNTGRVVATEWQRVVHQERFAPITKQDWQSELRGAPTRMPVNGAGEVPGVDNVRGCFSAQRGTRQVPDGTERVCRTKSRQESCGTEEKCTRKKLNNGFMKEECHDVTKYCSRNYQDCSMETRYRSEPVYAQKCTYDTYAWKEVDKREASGHDDTPRWPEMANIDSYDRLRREEKYSVTFEYTEGREAKQGKLEYKTEAEFLPFRKDQQVNLKVNNLGELQAALAR